MCIDASDPFHSEREAEVCDVLEDIGAGSIPVLKVYNKIDLTDRDAGVLVNGGDRISAVAVSALSGEGIDALREAIDQHLSGQRVRRWVRLEGSDARLRAQLYEQGAVLEEVIAEDGAWNLHVDLPANSAEQLARFPGP